MSVVALFKCIAKVPDEYGNYIVKFWTDYNSGKGNEDFASATPWGQLDMSISKDRPAQAYFEVGKQYKLIFTENLEAYDNTDKVQS